MYLQVESDNHLACLLYNRTGFTEICRYHYRTEGALARGPTAPGSSRR